MSTERWRHATALLATGQVLVAGGDSTTAVLNSAELYDPGLVFDSNWQPLLTMVSPFILPGSELTASGSRFQGISEASGGNGAQNSSSNYPLVQLLSLANEQTLFLPVDTMAGWSDTSFTSRADHSDDYQFERLPHWLRACDCFHQRHPQPITVRTRPQRQRQVPTPTPTPTARLPNRRQHPQLHLRRTAYANGNRNYATATATATFTPTATATLTSTPTATATATATPTPTATVRPTPTPRSAPTPRPRPTPAPRP